MIPKNGKFTNLSKRANSKTTYNVEALIKVQLFTLAIVTHAEMSLVKLGQGIQIHC